MSTSAYSAGHGYGHSPPPIGPPAQAGASGLPQISIHTVLVALRCWWHVALPMGLLLAAGAATVVYYITTPTYTATAWIEISPPLNIIPGSTNVDSIRFVDNQIALMRSPLVLDPVVGLSAVRSAPELREEEDPVLYLRNSLRIKPFGNSDYFTIEFTSADPGKAKVIVNAVADSYFNLYQRHDSKAAEDTIKILTQQATTHSGEVDRLRKDVDKLARELSGEQGLPPATTSDKLQLDAIDQQLEAQLVQARLKLVTTQAELQAEEGLLLKEDFTPPEDIVARRVEADERVATLRARTKINKEKRDEYLERGKNLAANPAFQQLEKDIAADEKQLEEAIKGATESATAELTRSAQLKRQAQILELQADVVKQASIVTFLESSIEAKKVESKELSDSALQLERKKREERRAEAFFEALQTKIQSLKAQQHTPLRVKPLQEATAPTRPDEEIPLKKMIMAALAAMVLPFGLAVGIEVLFGRVANRKQLESASRVSVVGEITSLPRRLKGQVSGDAPRRDVQLFEESINGLRTYLTLIEASRGRRVLAVTSSISREGKTSLAAQLAMSVANSTGKPTLLIDGDMRSPDIHRIFDVEVGPGLAEVLTGRVPLEEAIETEVSSRLHLLTAGRLSASPHQLTGGGGFAATIERLRGMYENIIIDTPPILSASEALIMSGAADATIVCVRRDYSRVDQVSESVQRLVASGVKVAGAVLNGVPTQHYAYRYGSYYYTRERTEEVDADTAEVPRAAG